MLFCSKRVHMRLRKYLRFFPAILKPKRECAEVRRADVILILVKKGKMPYFSAEEALKFMMPVYGRCFPVFFTEYLGKIAEIRDSDADGNIVDGHIGE